ncbi:MAG: glycosyltransferase [Armatimonadota bacterium]|nr:glycosyltransferase [Armatimonadota bacterium]
MSHRIAMFLPSLGGGGAERVFVNLSQELVQRGWLVDMVLVRAEGSLLKQLHPDVAVRDLRCTRTASAILPLRKYLEIHRPHLLLSAMTHANIVALLARGMSRHKLPTVVTEHNNLSHKLRHCRRMGGMLFPVLIRLLYTRAEAIVAVSAGVARDLSRYTRVREEKIHVIYNPVVTEGMMAKAREAVEHPWLLSKQDKVILSVGRLTKQKDYETLLHAFAMVRSRIPVKLVLLGEGEERESLWGLAERLGVSQHVDMPGFVENPYSYMRAADVFVLSSRWEGLSNVLVEALAVGTPVVSTDCPYGPAEILKDGALGRLCAVGDAKALAEAIIETLNAPPPPAEPPHYMAFTVEYVANRYVELFERLIGNASARPIGGATGETGQEASHPR